MIYILTVHWENPDWIELQLKYLNKNVSKPHKKFSFLNIQTRKYDKHFDYVSHENIKRHASKLNILADLALMDSNNDNDILIFIDGDAFPINKLMPFVEEKLSNHPLTAVQRLENLGDKQPHPCFCATTVGFWKKINGDWNPGCANWIDKSGKHVSDLGGKILKVLNESNIKWFPCLRSNSRNPHPLHYGVYNNLIYHHGAGFRNPATRTDLEIANRKKIRTMLYHQLGRVLPKKINKKYFRPMNKIVNLNKQMSESVFEFIKSDENFYNYFLQNDSECNIDLAKQLIEKFETIK